MSRQLTGGGPPRSGGAPTSVPAAPSISNSSSSSSSSSSTTSSHSHPASTSTAGWGLSSTAPTTAGHSALTSPSSSTPVSPFASPVAQSGSTIQQQLEASAGVLDAGALASAEEGHARSGSVSDGFAHVNGRLNEKDGDEDGRFARRTNGGEKGGGNGGDWEELLQQAKAAGRAWRKTWEKEGWNGVSSKLRRTRLPSLSTTHRTLTSSPRYISLRSFLSLIPPRRRLTALLTFILIAAFLLLSPSSSAPSSLSSPLSSLSRARSKPGMAAKVLTSSTMGSKVLRPKGYPGSANKAKVVESQTNPYGFMNLIDPYAGGIFNPSVLVLPDQVGLGWRHLLVARGPEKYEVIQGEDTRWEKVVGCFLLPLQRAHLSLPYLARESELETLNLPAKRKVEYLRCHDPVFDQFIGPEDPRLFFTNDGQPLIIFSQTGRSPNICRALYVIDARMVIPGLDKALKKAGWNAPVEFREQTDLIRENQFNIEKNWSPFLGENDELFFHVSLVPQQIYKWVRNLTLRPLDPVAPSHNCLTDLLGADMNRVHLHHATPLLRATLCKRGECVPDVHNTVLFGIIHVKYHPLPYLHYVRHVVTWNVTSPYEYLSVSRPLTYSGTNQADPIFTVSMAWDHPTDHAGLGLNHGFLDENVLISFGVADYGSGYIDVLAHDLLTDHDMCSGVGGSSLWQH
ncbi:hypothetical protein JCM8547_006465 [Rhodosporidiobolus lusitaniae]